MNQLNYPTYIFIDQHESLYISDCYNHRLVKWIKGSNKGIIVAGGQTKGENLSQLSYPNGIIVDSSENVYIADSWNNRIIRWPPSDKQGTMFDINTNNNHFYY